MIQVKIYSITVLDGIIQAAFFFFCYLNELVSCDQKISKNKCQFLALGQRFCRLEWSENYAMMSKDKTVMNIPGILKYL